MAADNASLNQILREIGRQTGISISGGVAEERVFGRYGPGTASDVLTTLLEGTGSNMLLVPAEDESKGQLILTPRRGGPTPPNPNAPGFDDDPGGDEDGAQRSRPIRGVSLYGNQPDTQGAPAAPTNGLPASATDPANPTGTTQQQSPNGVKTPQEIFQQLQQLRQQQQQTTTPPQ